MNVLGCWLRACLKKMCSRFGFQNGGNILSDKINKKEVFSDGAEGVLCCLPLFDTMVYVITFTLCVIILITAIRHSRVGDLKDKPNRKQVISFLRYKCLSLREWFLSHDIYSRCYIVLIAAQLVVGLCYFVVLKEHSDLVKRNIQLRMQIMSPEK